MGGSNGETRTPPKKHEPLIETNQLQGEETITRLEEPTKTSEKSLEEPTPSKTTSKRRKKVSIIEPFKEGRVPERITRSQAT